LIDVIHRDRVRYGMMLEQLLLTVKGTGMTLNFQGCNQGRRAMDDVTVDGKLRNNNYLIMLPNLMNYLRIEMNGILPSTWAIFVLFHTRTSGQPSLLNSFWLGC
jgi:hypothetical protein